MSCIQSPEHLATKAALMPHKKYAKKLLLPAYLTTK